MMRNVKEVTFIKEATLTALMILRHLFQSVFFTYLAPNNRQTMLEAG